MESVFNRRFDIRRSLLIRCPKCGSDPHCSVTRPRRWPVWFYCTSCKFSGDLLAAVTQQTGLTADQACEEIQKLVPTFDLPEFLETHHSVKARTNKVNWQWAELRNSQNFDFKSRKQFTKVPDISWSQYLLDEVIVQPITVRSLVDTNRRRLIFRVYDRPGLPCGLRSGLGIGHAGRYLDRGVAFLAGGCQTVTSPVADVILTQDAAWAIEQHGRYWAQHYQPAPIIMPMGRNRILRECFGQRVVSMVAWHHDPYRSIRLAMEQDCRVSTLLSPPSTGNVADCLNRLVESAVYWPVALSRVIMETSYLGALLDVLPPIEIKYLEQLSVRANRKLQPFLRQRKMKADRASPAK